MDGTRGRGPNPGDAVQNAGGIPHARAQRSVPVPIRPEIQTLLPSDTDPGWAGCGCLIAALIIGAMSELALIYLVIWRLI